MLKSVKLAAIAVAMAALLPAATYAASATFGYANVQIATNSTFTTGLTSVPLVGTPATGYTATIPAGSYVRFSRTGFVGATNPNAAATSAYNTVVVQPAFLGLNSYQEDLSIATTGGASLAAVGGIGNKASDTILSLFTVKDKGNITATGLTNIGGGLLTGSDIDGSDNTTFNKATIGVAGSVNLYSALVLLAGATPGTATLSATSPAGTVAFVVNSDPGSNVSPPTYTIRNADGTDTVSGPGNLTLTIAAAPEPASLAVIASIGGLGLIRRRRAV